MQFRNYKTKTKTPISFVIKTDAMTITPASNYKKFLNQMGSLNVYKCYIALLN